MKPATSWFDESFAPIVSSSERFARQQRLYLPCEFLHTSARPTIDHQLSGHNDCAHADTPSKPDGRRYCTPFEKEGHTSIPIRYLCFHFAPWFSTIRLAQASNSLVRVSRRVMRASIKCIANEPITLQAVDRGQKSRALLLLPLGSRDPQTIRMLIFSPRSDPWYVAGVLAPKDRPPPTTSPTSPIDTLFRRRTGQAPPLPANQRRLAINVSPRSTAKP